MSLAAVVELAKLGSLCWHLMVVEDVSCLLKHGLGGVGDIGRALVFELDNIARRPTVVEHKSVLGTSVDFRMDLVRF